MQRVTPVARSLTASFEVEAKQPYEYFDKSWTSADDVAFGPDLKRSPTTSPTLDDGYDLFNESQVDDLINDSQMDGFRVGGDTCQDIMPGGKLHPLLEETQMDMDTPQEPRDLEGHIADRAETKDMSYCQFF